MTNEKKLNTTDREFNIIRSYVQNCTEQEITKFICENFVNWGNKLSSEVLQCVINFYKTYKFGGVLDPAENNIELIQQRASVIKNQWKQIEELYDTLSDYRSKNVLVAILTNWLTFQCEDFKKVKEYNFKPYFDMDLLHIDEQEVFVDLGSCEGDTIDDYMTTYGNNFKRIYAYEILEQNINILKPKFAYNGRIIVRPVGVSDTKGTMYLSENRTKDSHFLVNNGNTAIETVTLDEDIKEKITFLKMDIEGAERAAILGAQKHIIEDKPKMAISIYHSNEDLFDIFSLIKSIQPEYKFYLRYYGALLFPTDYVLICIPK